MDQFYFVSLSCDGKIKNEEMGMVYRYIIILLFLSIFSQQSFAMQSLVNEIELPVPDPQNPSQISIEKVNLATTSDVILQDSLKEIIEGQFNIAPGYIIARVSVSRPGKTIVNYYDAGNFNLYLFQSWYGTPQLYPVYPEDYREFYNKKDPATGLPFINPNQITYYYGKLPSQKRLEYLGFVQDLQSSYQEPQQQLEKRQFMQKLLRALYGQDESIRKQAQQELNLKPVSISTGRSLDDLIQEFEKLFEIFKKQLTDAHYNQLKQMWRAQNDQFKNNDDVQRINKFADAIIEHIQTNKTPSSIESELNRRRQNAVQWRELFAKATTGERKEMYLNNIISIMGDALFISTDERNKTLDDYLEVLTMYKRENNRTKAQALFDDVFDKIRAWSRDPIDDSRLLKLQELAKQVAPSYENAIKRLQEQRKETAEKPQALKKALDTLVQQLKTLHQQLQRL